MDRFFEFLKKNTAIVAVAAGIVLFIAMNGITSCVTHGDGGNPPTEQHDQVERSEDAGTDGSQKERVSLSEAQRDVAKDYDDATQSIVATLENSKWGAIDGTGSMTIKDGIITEKYGDTDGDKTKTVTKKQSFAITAADTLGADQSGALSWNVLSVIDSDGKSHIMTLSTVNPAANGEGNDEYHDISCDLFHNEGGYTNSRSCEDVSIPALDDPNFKSSIDGKTKELRASLVEYLLANHSTTTELVWDGAVTDVFANGVKTFSFGIRNANTGDDDSSTRINVTYHTDTHEFEEVDVQ